MAETNKILEVKDLRISFNVDSGTVKAVRGISFDLYRGKTLCIVGESGSGKSVTSRAILGILAKNAIIEGGEIIYDGKDLLTINEERFHKIRGSKISMIFQDPLSALNPIMRVGKQLIDPIFLKARSARREAKGTVHEITHNISAVAQRHGIAVDLELLRRFKEYSLEDLANETAEREFERQTKVYERSTMMLERADQYPSKTLKEAKEYLAKNPERPVKPVLSDEKHLSEEERTQLRNLFVELIRVADEDYRNELLSLKEVVGLILGGPLSEPVGDLDALKSQYPAVKKAICSFAFRDDEDDRIAVFATSYRKYVDFLAKSFANLKKQEKRAASYEKKGQEVPPLTLKERAKLPEKSQTPEEASDILRRLCQQLADHIDELLASPLVAEEYVDTFLDYYRQVIKDAYRKVSQAQAKEQALEIMRQVGIPQPEIRFRQYPFEFSGGMRQRIVIAIALSSRPEILICDEPTTALDVTIQAQILELINQLKAELNLSIIFITHDLGVVANMADDIAVMYAGKIVEYGTADDIFYDPRHPYTWALLASMPDLDTKQRIDAIPGTPPNMILPPIGDAFAVRNKYALAIDFEEEPPLFEISETHAAATWLLAPDAPKATPPEIVTARIERALAKRKAPKKKAGKEKKDGEKE